MDYNLPAEKELFGLWSEHTNRGEDRRWRARICHTKCGPEATYTLISVDWDRSAMSNLPKNPKILDTTTILNPTDAEVKKTIRLEETIEETTTTSWSHTLGGGVSVTVATDFVFGDVESTISLNYDYTQGKETSKTTSELKSQGMEVMVHAHTSITANLVIEESPSITIPFKATFKKTTGDGRTSMVTETGTWSGVLYYNVRIELDDVKS